MQHTSLTLNCMNVNYMNTLSVSITPTTSSTLTGSPTAENWILICYYYSTSQIYYESKAS